MGRRSGRRRGLAATARLAVSPPNKVLDVNFIDAVRETGRRGMAAPTRTALNIPQNNIRYRKGGTPAHKSLDTVR